MLKQLPNLCALILLSSLIFLASCQSTSPTQPQTINNQESTAPEEKALPHQTELDQITQLINSGDIDAAQIQINHLASQALNIDERLLLIGTQAQLLNQQQQYSLALNLLNESSLQQQLDAARINTQIQLNVIKATTLEHNGDYIEAVKLRIAIAPQLTYQENYLNNHYTIWLILKKTNKNNILEAIQQSPNNEFKQWLELSLISQHSSASLNQQIQQIEKWQHAHALHPAALIPLPEIATIRTAARFRPEKIAIILPFDGKYKVYANTIRDGLMQAYYNSDYQPQLSFYSLDQQQTFLDIYQAAIDEGAELIIGPLFKQQLQELYSFNILPVPTIALNRLEKDKLAQQPENLWQYSLSSEDEINSLIQLLSLQNKTKALILHQDAQWARDSSAYFQQQWAKQGYTTLKDTSFDSSTNQSQAVQKLLNIDKSRQRIRQLSNTIATNLEAEPRRRMDADFVFVLAKPQLATSLRPMLDYHYASDLPIYSTSKLYRGYSQGKVDNDFNGITFSDLPWVITPPVDLPEKYTKSSLLRMYAFGYDAFQLAERLKLMQDLEHSQLNGATGIIKLEQQDFSRQTALARFSRGKAINMPMPTIADESIQ